MMKVSVIMPVLNAERFIAQALGSIIAQTHKSWELLVLDGGSTDTTINIIHNVSDQRVKLLHAPPGIKAALNIGLQHASCEWIARQDADDISLPTRLESQIRAISRNPRAVLCYTDAEMFGANCPNTKTQKFVKTKALLALKLCFQCPVVHSSVLVRKDAIAKCGGYKLDKAEDYDLWGRLLQIGDTVAVDRKLVRFRRHESSASSCQGELLGPISRNIAVNNCGLFMRLSAGDAFRAYTALAMHGTRHGRNEWRWFVSRCLPRLRWKSPELFAWVLWQTIKSLV